MKKVLSVIIATAMLFSMLPMSVMAEMLIENEPKPDCVQFELSENYGKEVVVGNSEYYIMENSLYCSKDSGRPVVIANDVGWIVDNNGEVYYSRHEGFNTLIYKIGYTDAVVKIFCPIDCFDVDDEYIYYSYNGDVTKISILTNEEFGISSKEKIGLFYIDENKGIVSIDPKSVGYVSEDEGVELMEELNEQTLSRAGKKLLEKYDEVIVTNTGWYWPAGTEADGWNDIKSFYGVDPLDGSNNCGINIGINSKPVYAAKAGLVVYHNYKGDKTEHGNCVVIYHGKDENGNRIFSTYKHLSKDGYKENGKKAKVVKKNAEVQQGEIIGLSSNTGGYYYNNTWVNYDNQLNFSIEVNYYLDENSFENHWSTNPTLDLLQPEGELFDRSEYMDLTNPPSHNECSENIQYIFNCCDNCANAGSDKFEFRDNGVCVECEKRFNYETTTTKASSGLSVGKYTRVDNNYKEIYLRPEPYGTNLVMFGEFNEIDIISAVINAGGEKWYKIKIGEEEGYAVANKIDKDFEYVQPYEESEITIDISKYPTGKVLREVFEVNGNITSKYNLQYVKYEVVDAVDETVVLEDRKSLKTSTYVIEEDNYFKNLKLDTLKTGREYYLRFTAGDETTNDAEKGNPTTWVSENFSVVERDELVSKAPAVSVVSIEEGQRAVVKCDSKDATIHVMYDSREITGTESVVLDFTEAGNHVITAWTTEKNKEESVKVQKSISVTRMAAPSISLEKYTEDGILVTISGNGKTYYTTDGTTPAESSTEYTAPIYVKKDSRIRAISKSFGYADSECVELDVEVRVPAAPEVKLEGEEKVAQGQSVAVLWEEIYEATEYTAHLLRGDEVVDMISTSDTRASFILDERNDEENIEYTIYVVAHNFKGDSNISDEITVTAMHPLEVRVVDKIERGGSVTDEVVLKVQDRINEHDKDDAVEIEGNVISFQKVDYGSKPSKPITPSKKGFTFAGYSEELYYPVTEDIEVEALYEINYYTVEFWNIHRGDKSTEYLLGETQNVMYTDRAIPPTGFAYPKGFVLSGWNVDNTVSTGYDYRYVDGDMKLYTSYTFAEENFLASVAITGASRNKNFTSYTVNLEYINNNLTATQARLIVSLYTKDGRMVYTQTKDVDLNVGETATDSVQLDYANKVSKISAVLVRVNNDLTGGPASRMAYTENIEFPATSGYWGNWSEWSTTAETATDTRQVEVKKQYRYTDKKYTSATSKTLSGWNHYNTTASTGNWSAYSQTAVSAFSTEAHVREVESYWEPATYKTQYHYFSYYKGSSAPWSHYSSSHPYLAEIWVDYELPFYRYSGGLNQYGGSGYDFGYPFYRWLKADGTTYGLPNSSEPYFTRQVQTGGGYTMYRYRDTYYTYYFWQWGNWSDWSDIVYSKTGERDVEEREMYRYRDYYPVYDPALDDSLEEETLETHFVEGNIPGVENDFSNRVATVMVYKKTNTDPTQEQLEYVEQITIGDNNYYSITINPKDKLDYVDTGDYIVTMSIEGCERLVNVDVIEAPVPTYEVVFYSEDGVQFGETQMVKHGGGVDVNEIGIPEKEGHRFVKWDKSVVNITKNTSVTAVYEKENYAIVFVDHENKTAEINEYSYGEPIVAPDVEAVEGKKFDGWDIFDKTNEVFATESMIVTAKWRSLSYNVKFCDFEGNVISEQVVEYGDSAEPPECVTAGDVQYSWDISHGKWWNVTEDMIVYPYVPQTVNVDAPTINASTENTTGMFYAQLETSQADGTIYYSLYDEITMDEAQAYAQEVTMDKQLEDAQEAVLMSEESGGNASGGKIREYTDSVKLKEGTILYAFTVDEDGNISPISVFKYDYPEYGEDDTSFEPDAETPAIVVPDVNVKPGEEVKVPITIRNNPGITGLSIIVGYSADDLVLTDVENGNVFSDEDSFTQDIREGGNCKFTWDCSDVVTGDGTLITLTFATTGEEGNYDITICTEDVVAPNNEENPFGTIDGEIASSDKLFMLGDANGDGKVDFVDAILVLRYDSGLGDISEDRMEYADVNFDGEVDFIDATLILRYDVGMIKSFD